MKKIIAILTVLTFFIFGCTKVQKEVKQIIDGDKKEDTTLIEESENIILEEDNDSLYIEQDTSILESP